ncbi:unnamed protein product [Gongylonema pulchrum]|uniref:Uncharacterized protein n=1 Tax=Gongylonema pulchrum TaxID=637853 RepID=A0A3P7MYL8_9BILA|nr:unnamed protein product [Gongylonema pulchrum]
MTLPTFPDNLWDHDYDFTRMGTGSVWQSPQTSASNWPPRSPTNTTTFMQSQHQSPPGSAHSYLAESVRAFRLNPEAPPFVIENPTATVQAQRPTQLMTEHFPPLQHSQQQHYSTLNPVFSQSELDHLHGTLHHNTYIDDPLGLSGSLFGRRGAANIWASDLQPTSSSSTNNNNNNNNTSNNSAEPSSAAVYWAEKFLADEDNDMK